jgi:flagellar motor switch protein FliM
MEPLLTAEELEALKQAQQPLDAQAREVRSVDLVACDHRAYAMLPELQQSADRLARGLEGLLTRSLRAGCRAEQRPVEIVPGGRLQELWGEPRFVYSVELDGQQDAAAVALDGFVGGAFVSRQFGGGIELPALDRAATGTERRTVARLASELVGTVVEALRPVADVEGRLCAERSGQPAGAAVVLFAIDVRIGEHSGRVSLAVSTTCSCFEGRSGRPSDAPLPTPSAELLPALAQVGVEVRANLGQRPITMREFFALAPGDVLTLDTPVDTEIEVMVADKRKFVGVPLLQHGLLSVRLSGVVKE